MSGKLTKRDGWNAVEKTIHHLPESVVHIFDETEQKTGLHFDDAARKRYFREFYRMSCGSPTIQVSEMRELVYALLRNQLDEMRIQNMLNRKLGNSLESESPSDFTAFVSLVGNVLQSHEDENIKQRISFWQYCRNNALPIDPDSFWKQSWDILIMLLLLYSSFQVPYTVVFEVDTDPNTSSAADDADVSLDVIFMVDVGLCFLTSYYDINGVLVNRLAMISERYLKTWFFLDLGGSFPFDRVIALFLASTGNIGALRILKMVRMLKLLRAVKVFKALSLLGQREGFEWLKATIGITQSVLMLVFFAHLLGCLFALLFVTSSGTNWMYVYNPDLKNADGWTKYVTALYWAIISITTMGYGDIVPTTHYERFFCIFVAVIGAIVFSYCIGKISGLMTEVTGIEQRINEKQQALTEYFDFRQINRDFKRLIKKASTFRYRQSGDFHHESQILNELSVNLRKSVLRDVGSNFEHLLPIFQGFDQECIGFIVSKLRRVDFRAGDTIYQQGDIAGEAFLIITGTVLLGSIRSNLPNESWRKRRSSGSTRSLFGDEEKKVVDEEACTVATDGDLFGEQALFPELASPVRADTVVAKTFVETYSLTAQMLQEIAEAFPAVLEKLKELCTLRSAELKLRTGRQKSKGDRFVQAQPYKLKALVAQLQHDLLAKKKLDLLVPASGPEGSKVLSMFMKDSEQGELRWVGISCVLSERGELLCLENTIAGAVREQPRSLGHFALDKSRYSILSRSEVEAEVEAFGTTNMEEIPHGCAVWTWEAGAEAAREVRIFTWMEDDLEVLVQSFENFISTSKRSSKKLLAIDVGSRVDSISSITARGLETTNQLRPLPLKLKAVQNPNSLAASQSGRLLTPLPRTPSCNTPMSFFDKSSDARTWVTTDNRNSRTVQIRDFEEAEPENEETVKINLKFFEHIVGQLEQSLEEILASRKDVSCNNTLGPSVLYINHLKLLEKYSDGLRTAIVGVLPSKRSLHYGDSETDSRAPFRRCFGNENHLTKIKSSNNDSQTKSTAKEDRPSLRDPQRETRNNITITGSNFGAGTGGETVDTLSETLNHLEYPVLPGMMLEDPSPELVLSVAEGAPRAKVLETLISGPRMLESRWCLLSKGLLKLHGWTRVKNLYCALPSNILKAFEDVEVLKGCRFDDKTRKRYYREYCRKACGLPAIHYSEIEELIYILHRNEIDGDTLHDLQHKIRKYVHDAEGLCDFSTFMSIVCDTLFCDKSQLPDKHNTLWHYFYDRFLPIHPEFGLKQGWDVVIMAMLLYSSFQVPYDIVFGNTDMTNVNYASPAEGFDLFLDVLFMVDVGLSFFTSYYDRNGMLEMRLGKISKHYLKTWFLPDLGGSFPFDKVIALFLTSAIKVGALRILKLVRMLKLLRAAKVLKALGELGHREGFSAVKNIVGILRATFVMVLAGHILGCFFTLLFVTPNSINWMYMYNPSLEFADNWTRYVTALYWAMISITTMGYGDIRPVVLPEQLYCIMVATVGSVVFSFCMGAISSLVTSVSGTEQLFREKMQHVTEYLHFRRIPRELKIKIKGFYSGAWRTGGDLHREQQILNELPTHFRKSLLREIGAQSKDQIPLLHTLDNECLGLTMTRLKLFHVMKGEKIYQRGDTAREAFFVVAGEVILHIGSTVTWKDGSPGAEQQQTVISAGDIFGEMALFPKFLQPYREETAVARTACTAYSLALDDLQLIAAEYPLVVQLLEELCALRVAMRKHQKQSFAGLADMSSQAQPFKLKALVSHLQRELLEKQTRALLVPASGPLGSKVLSLFRVTQSVDVRCSRWVGMRMVISEQGELLYLDNTTTGVAQEAVLSLGFFVLGRSLYQILTEEETRAQMAGTLASGVLPCCCKVLIFDRHSSTAWGAVPSSSNGAFISSVLPAELRIEAALAGSGPPCGPPACTPDARGMFGDALIPRELLLFSWLEDDFNDLISALKDYSEG